MKCLKCGFEFTEGIFCPECGNKYDAESAKAEQEKLEKEQREKEERELELAKQKAEQERIEKEAEIELAKQKAEQLRLENEAAALEAEKLRLLKEKEDAEREAKQKEELSRTFNGQVYSTKEEMLLAKETFEKEEALQKKLKKANSKSVWSLILALATYPLTLTIFLWFPSIIISIILGIYALIEKTEKKGIVITSFILNGVFLAIIILAILLSL